MRLIDRIFHRKRGSERHNIIASALLHLDFTSGNQTLDPRITFTRASNATLTDSTGNIAYAPHNLLTYSEQFDNAAWLKAKATVTANAATAPDGTATADTITDSSDASSAVHAVQAPVAFASGVVYTVSVHVKAGTLPGAAILFPSAAFAGNIQARFNVATGVVESVDTGVTASIVPLPNGWYRCVATATATASATSNIQLRLATATTMFYQGTGAGTVFLWGAQLNVGALQPYYPTTVKNLLGYTQEFDNAAWTKSNSFIQTNLLTYSEQFDNAAWSKTRSTVTANTAIAPDGTSTADSFAGDATTGPNSHSVQQGFSVQINTIYVLSFYVKAGNITQILVRASEATTWGGDNRALFNLSTGSVSVTAGSFDQTSIIPVGNGWYRCVVAKTAGQTASGQIITINLAKSGTPFTEISASEMVYIWGAQLVQGSTPGDYQRTEGTAKAVMYQAPDGTMSADKLVEDTANAIHQVRTTTFTPAANTLYTLSVYAKKSENRYLHVGFPTAWGGSSGYVVFDLETGTQTYSSNAGLIFSIDPAGDGWYRCRVGNTVTISAPSTAYIGINSNSTTGTNYTGDGTSGIYIWGAQLSDSASLDPYVYNPGAAPSASAYYGPRFDYDPVTLQPKGLLIEEQRTNLLLQSEALDSASWTNSNNTVTANAIVSPDGTQDADKIVENTVAGVAHEIRTPSVTLTSGVTYTASFYAKIGERRYLRIGYASVWGTPNNYAVFDLQDGSNTYKGNAGLVTTSTFVGNGWYRLTVRYTVTATSTGTMYVGVNTDPTTGTTYTGDGTSGLFVWGAQLEAGDFPTSYIPTTTAQATRAADVATMTGTNFSNWYRQDEGTFYSEASTFAQTATDKRVWSINTGSTANNISAHFGASSGGVNTSIINTGGVFQYGPSEGSYAGGVSYKRALAFINSNPQVVTNGVLGSTAGASTTVIPTGLDRLEIGNRLGIQQINGHIRRLAYFPRRLSNAELQGITS